MPVSYLRVFLLAAFVVSSGHVRAHVVPNMNMEADFNADGSYALRINVDPRAFLAADPTALPPVPASWYRDQTPEQIAATHEKAREYLAASLGLTFKGRKVPLPEPQFQAIDGADNTPIDAETQEVHLLATVRGAVPQGADVFRVDLGKEAKTPLILLTTQEGKAAPRAQVVFPGEEGKAVAIRAAPAKPQAAQPPSPPADSMNHVWLILVGGVTLVAVLVGWRLLVRYRHHHKFHRKPRSM